jgi:hypothetical protein
MGGITLLTHHGKSWSESLPPNFPQDIARLSTYVPAIIYVPDNPNIDKTGMILNASVYGMNIDHRGAVLPSGSLSLDLTSIQNWLKSLNYSSAKSPVANQTKPARSVHTSGTDGQVIPPVKITKL